MPGGVYRVELLDSLCLKACEKCYSPGVDMTTSILGDTVLDCSSIPCPPAEGVVNIIDIFAILQRFGSQPNSINKPRAEMEPGCVDLFINITDVLVGLLGFGGESFPFAPSAAGACASTCVSPLP